MPLRGLLVIARVGPLLVLMAKSPFQPISMSTALPCVCLLINAGSVTNPNALAICLAAERDFGISDWPVGSVCTHSIATPTMSGTSAGRTIFLAIFQDQCIKYARSGGLKVDDIWTDAPDWLKAAKKSSKLERKGSVQSRGFALPRNFATQLVPLNSFATAFPVCRSDCVIGNTSLGRRPVGSQFAAFAATRSASPAQRAILSDGRQFRCYLRQSANYLRYRVGGLGEIPKLRKVIV